MKKFLLAVAVLIILAGTAKAKLVTDKLPLLTYVEVPVSLYEKPNGTIPVEIKLVPVKEI